MSGKVYAADALNNTIRKGIPFLAPLIWRQPISEARIIGSGFAYQVYVSGTPAPTIQWQKNGVNIIGATSDIYDVLNAAASDAGTYTVIATNTLGSTISEAWTLSIITTRFDFAGDGWSEPLWRNAGTGEVRTWFATGGSLGFGSEGGGWAVIDTGDFDGDGWSEPLWRSALTGEIRTWFMMGGSLGFGTESGGWSVID